MFDIHLFLTKCVYITGLNPLYLTDRVDTGLKTGVMTFLRSSLGWITFFALRSLHSNLDQNNKIILNLVVNHIIPIFFQQYNQWIQFFVDSKNGWLLAFIRWYETIWGEERGR